MKNIEINVKNILNKISSGNNFSYNEAKLIFEKLVEGKIIDSDAYSILKEISLKGETVDEILAMIEIIKHFSITIHPKFKNTLFDICGTGGSKIKTFNISTAAAIVAASAGCNIAKHGNRSASGVCGSADFLEYIGINLDNPPHMVSRSIEEDRLRFFVCSVISPCIKKCCKIKEDNRYENNL